MICTTHFLGNAAVYARYSSDLQDKTSIDGQIRKARDWAQKNGFVADDVNCFTDEAVSGTKGDRPGLDRMLAAAEQGRFSILIVESLSRLGRNHVYASMVMMHLVYVLKIRIVGIDDGCDTNGSNWELLAGIKNILNEQYIRDLGKMVHRGQVENLVQGFSNGDLCFGYRSVPVSGKERGTGRNRKVKMCYSIDEKQAVWVRRIFDWFVNERKPIRWIARELTRLGAPTDRRSTTGRWHHASVRRLLANKKYVGIWSWGEKKSERNPINGMVRHIKREADEIAKYTRSFPELRLIDDSQFDKAKKLLEVNKTGVGDFDEPLKRSPSGSVKHFLSRLIKEEVCCRNKNAPDLRKCRNQAK